MPSELKVNKLSPYTGTTLTLGDSGDTITLASGVSLTGVNATFSGDLTVDTNTLYVDSTNNRVGIGTSSPARNLSIVDSSTPLLQLALSTDQAAGNGFELAYDGSAAYLAQRENLPMVFKTNDTERMRIDSSGNVLVGTTSFNADNVGIGLRSSDGLLYATRSGGSPVIFNRTTSDGTTAIFRKDGVDVGSIATLNSTLVIGSGDTGLLFSAGDDVVIPRNSSTASRDNAIGLGDSGNRFKDLYLGGSVYLGGTTSANALDDYEEGTWTPIYTTDGTNFTSVTYDFRNAYYTKIGRQVTCTLSMRTDAITKGSASGSVVLGGLPFQVDKDAYVPVAIGTDFAVNNPSGIRILDNTTTAYLQKGYNNGSLAVSDMGTGANDNFIALVFTYFTD